MKKLFSLLSLTLLFVFIGSSLYIFDLPPFQTKNNLMPSATEQKITEKNIPVPPVPMNEAEKIARMKSYEEHMKRAELLEKNSYNILALAEYEEAGKIQPENIDPSIRIGRIHLRNRELPLASENFKLALKIQPENGDAKIYLGRTLLAERKIQEAQAVFNSIKESTQQIQYYQGIIAAYFGENEKSKKLLTSSLELGKDIDLTNKAKNFLNAFSEFENNKGGQKTHFKTLLARSFNQTGEYQAAIGLLFEVVKEENTYRDAWIILGHSYLNLEKYPEALDALNQARILDPTKAETYFYLGLNYLNMNKLTDAAANLEKAKALGFQPVIQINQKLAEIYLQLNQYDKAASNYEAVVALNDEDLNYFIRPIWLNIEKLNKPEKALSLAQKALEDHPGNAMAYNLMGWALIATNELEAAEKNLQLALKKDPNLDAVYLNYGALKEKKGELNEATNYYKKAHDLGNGNSISNAAAARFNVLLAKIKEAEAQTLKANVLNTQ